MPALPGGPLSRRLVAAVSGIAAILAMPGRRRRPAPRLPARPPRPPASRTGPAITLATGVGLSGYDAATDSAGTSYIGWIASHGSRGPHHLPVQAAARRDQVRRRHPATPSLGEDSAAGLRVVVTPRGKVTLVWPHDDTASEYGPDGNEITTATLQSDGSLSAPSDQATAPSFGAMMDAAVAPDGSIFVLTEPIAGNGSVQVRPGSASRPST